jgi:hypothetical protein
MKHRLDRRLVILRGKRNGCFDYDQYYLERAERARVARQVRHRLRRMEPIVLITPRWSQAMRFLDDVGADLTIGRPRIESRTLNLAPLRGLSVPQAWAWLVQALGEFLEIKLDGPAWHAVSRHGFRFVMTQLFNRAQGRDEERCLMIHGLEFIHIEALKDLMQVFEEFMIRAGDQRRTNLLLAGAIDAAHLEFAGATRIVLPDFHEVEAVEALVEALGPIEAHRLQSIVELVGGVPAILDQLGAEEPSRISEIVANPESVWRILGGLAIEIRGAYEIVTADDVLSRRLDQLCMDGPQPEEEAVDFQLFRAGLVKRTRRGNQIITEVRAPVFSDLAQVS